MDYQKAYYQLFNAITDAIESLALANYGQAKEILIRAQQNGEEAFMQSEDKESKK